MKTVKVLKLQKKERLIRDEVGNITDGLGKHIDPGIKESVVAFQLEGFPTSQSGNSSLCYHKAYMKISTLKMLIENPIGPIVEVAGPTPGGYDVLNYLKLDFPAHTIITNISNTIIIDPSGDKPTKYKVDEVLDIRNYPVRKNYLGMILCSNLTLDPGQVIVFDSEEEKLSYWGKIKPKVLKEYDEYLSRPGGARPKLNQHIALFRYSSKALKSGGLLVFQGIMHKDNEIAASLGFRPLLTKKLESKLSTQIYQNP